MRHELQLLVFGSRSDHQAASSAVSNSSSCSPQSLLAALASLRCMTIEPCRFPDLVVGALVIGSGCTVKHVARRGPS